MSLDQWLQKVADLECKQDWVGLESMCKSKLDAEPNYVHALYPLGLALFRQGHYAASMRFLGRSAREAPTPHAWFRLAHAQHKVDRTEHAIESIQKAIELDPQQHELWHDLGTFLAIKRNYKAALKAFNTAHSIDPTNIDTLRSIGFMYAMSRYLEGVALVKNKIEAISAEDAKRFYSEAVKVMNDAAD